MNYRYLDATNREIGPVSLDALRAIRSSGVIYDGTLVQPEEGGPWSPLSSLLGAPLPPAAGGTAPIVATLRTALQDAWSTVRQITVDPAVAIPEVWSRLGAKRARDAGAALVLLTAVLFLLLVAMSDAYALFRPGNFGGYLKLLLAALVSGAGWVGMLVLGRRVFGGTPGYHSDAFLVGVLSIGWAVGMLGFAVLGWRNYQAALLLYLLIACLNVLQIFLALVRIDGVPERRATLAVPLVLVTGAWLTKIIFNAIGG